MKTIGRRQFLRTAGAGAAGAALGGLPFARIGRAQAKTLVLGGSIPLSGAAAETGLNVFNGYKAAIQYINEERGGIKIAGQTYRLELSMFDDASDPARATTLIQRQVDEGVNFYLGSFGSNIVLPTCAITERAKRPMVQAGGGSDLIFTQGRKYVFGIFPRASRQFLSYAAFFKRLRPAVKTVSIIYTNDPFSKFQADGARKSIEEGGIKVLDFIQLPAQVSDVSSVLATIRNNTPDILITNTHDENSLLIAKQMISSGTNVKLLYQALGPQTAAYRESLGKYADGQLTQTYWDEVARYKGDYFGSAKQFADYYRARYQRPLVYHMASAAVCIVCFVTAMQKANSVEPTAVRDALAGLDAETFYGHVRFTEQGDGDPILMGGLLGQVQKGKLEIVSPESAASAAPIYPVPAWNERT